MKISFCSIAFRKSPQSIAEIIPLLANLGYEGIEIWGNHLKGTLSSIQGIKNLTKKHNLPVAMVSPYFDLTGSQEAWQKSIETAQKFIDYASELEAPLVRCFTGVVGSKSATSQQRTACIEGLKIITKMASRRGIQIALETHPQTLVDNAPSTLTLLEEVAAENLKINLDIYHLWEVHCNSIDVLEKLFPYVAHIHAKNANLTEEQRHQNHHPFLHDKQAAQHFPGITYLSKGDMDYDSFLNALAEKNFSGYVSVEWFGENVLEAAKHELEYLRKFAT